MLKRGLLTKIHRKVLYNKKINIKNILPIYGEYSIVSLDNKIIEKKEIEAGRVLLTRILKNKKKKIKGIISKNKKKKLWIRCKFMLPYTKKGVQSRMGKGKGSIDRWVGYIHIMDPIYEFNPSNRLMAFKLFKAISHKLSMNIALVSKIGNIYYINTKYIK